MCEKRINIIKNNLNTLLMHIYMHDWENQKCYFAIDDKAGI